VRGTPCFFLSLFFVKARARGAGRAARQRASNSRRERATEKEEEKDTALPFGDAFAPGLSKRARSHKVEKRRRTS
jgi:hypothetical protein